MDKDKITYDILTCEPLDDRVPKTIWLPEIGRFAAGNLFPV